MITKISSVKMISYSQIFEVLKCFNALKLSTLKGLLGKSRFYLFFSSSDTQTLHHLLGCYATSINSSLIFFWSSLLFSNLTCLAKKRLYINYDLLLQQHFYSPLRFLCSRLSTMNQCVFGFSSISSSIETLSVSSSIFPMTNFFESS